MSGDSVQHRIFVNKCAELFRRTHHCEVEILPYKDEYSFDLLVHSDHFITVKCIDTGGKPIGADTVREVYFRRTNTYSEIVLITDGTFTYEAREECERSIHEMVLIDGKECSDLFGRYQIEPIAGMPEPEIDYTYQVKGSEGAENGELPMKKRLLAVIAALFVPGGGCFVLFGFTKKVKYLLIGLAFLIVSFILLQFLSTNGNLFPIVAALYIISIILSFVTLEVKVNDEATDEKRKEQCAPKDGPEEEYFDEKYKKRYHLSLIALLVAIFIPGGGNAVLFYMSRDRKQILYGNVLFWSSFLFMFNIISFDNSMFTTLMIIVIQIASFICTLVTIDPDIKKSHRSFWKLMIPIILLYISLHVIRGLDRDPDFFRRMFQTAMDIMVCMI